MISVPRCPGPQRCVLALTPASTGPTDAHTAVSPMSISEIGRAPNRDGRSIECGETYQGDAKLFREVSAAGKTSKGLFCAYQNSGAATAWNHATSAEIPVRTK